MAGTRREFFKDKMSHQSDDTTRNEENDDRPECKYGGKCYRVNPEHLAKFRHSSSLNSSQKLKRSPETETQESSVKKKARSVSPTKVENKAKDDNSDSDSSDEEEIPLPSSPQSCEENITQKYLVEMPPDFYAFWEFCKELNLQQPESALFDDLGLLLVGPYDVLSGKSKVASSRLPSYYFTKYRYYYDPPEFQTVIQGDTETQYHIGYFRDSPDEMPVFVAENEKKNGIINPIGDNIFAAVSCYMKEKLSSKKDAKTLEKLSNSLQKWAKKHKLSLEKKTVKMKERDKKVVAKCFHRAGMVVPYNKKTEVGYRPLPESDSNLKKILQKIVDAKTEKEKDKQFVHLQQLITFVQFANDECDYGMGLELALDLFTFGYPGFHKVISSLLPLAYELLGKPQFAKIAKAHLKNRVELIL